MAVSESLRNELLATLPNLRAFGLSLTKSADQADDLVQETVMKAWNKIDTFEEGTNLKAWLFTIMRNEFYSRMRKKGREVQDSEGYFTEGLATHPQQFGHMDIRDFRAALDNLPDDQREAIMLIGANGFSYDEAADILDVPVGTIKSRVSRARTKLMKMLDVEGVDDYGPDEIATQVLAEPPIKTK